MFLRDLFKMFLVFARPPQIDVNSPQLSVVEVEYRRVVRICNMFSYEKSTALLLLLLLNL